MNETGCSEDRHHATIKCITQKQITPPYRLTYKNPETDRQRELRDMDTHGPKDRHTGKDKNAHRHIHKND